MSQTGHVRDRGVGSRGCLVPNIGRRLSLGDDSRSGRCGREASLESTLALRTRQSRDGARCPRWDQHGEGEEWRVVRRLRGKIIRQGRGKGEGSRRTDMTVAERFCLAVLASGFRSNDQIEVRESCRNVGGGKVRGKGKNLG